MRKLILYLFLFSVPAQLFCQDTSETLPVFMMVEEMPEFPGGINSLMKFVSDNIRYPKEAKEKDIQGKVFASFVVDTAGSVRQVKILRGIPELNDEALRVVKMMPKWKPGRQSGKNVMVQYNLPIVFKLEDRKLSSEIISDLKTSVSFRKGNEELHDENYEKAIIHFTKAINENKNHAEAYFNRAICFNRLGFQNASCKDLVFAKVLGFADADTLIRNNCGTIDSLNQIVSEPQYIDGGDAGLITYIEENREYPELARKYNIQGTVTVKMNIDSLGNLTEAKVFRGIGGGCDGEALRLVKDVKLWKPGYTNGVAVNSWTTLPIRFKLKK